MSDILRKLTRDCREQLDAALLAAVLRPAALARAAELEAGKLVELQAAAAGPLAAVEAAQAALTAERQSIHARLSDFYASHRRKDPADREPPPERDTPKLRQLQAALTAATAEARPLESKARALGYEIAALRAVPEPDPATLAVLAEALNGGPS